MRSYVCYLLLLAATGAEAGNGSSGIGSVTVDLVAGVSVSLDPQRFSKEGDQIISAASQQIVLQLAPISAIAAKAEAKNYDPTVLGSVKAWEYLPDRDLEPAGKNAWIICGTTEDCVRVTVGNGAGRKAAELIGSLKNK